MSRTYRRQKGYIPKYVIKAAEPLKGHEAEDAERLTNSETWYSGKVPSYFRNYSYINGQWFVYGKNKAFGQRIAQWFGDHGYAWRRLYGKDVSKYARGEAQHRHRAKSQQEIAKFRKNPEYEVIVPRKELLPWD